MMFFLPWWTYVLIGTVAFVCSFGAVWLANIAQPGVAYGLGIDTAGMNKAAVSDAISVALESRALDPFIGVV